VLSTRYRSLSGALNCPDALHGVKHCLGCTPLCRALLRAPSASREGVRTGISGDEFGDALAKLTPLSESVRGAILASYEVCTARLLGLA
jgi:hypothetical protein